mmetsp:Transcript_31367/g.73166  ORF Transcript_31367/g.73166 Transcript_31367/m.73166 type:complete len:206 (-) Transcript_31367:138-755(-)|eukprot:CAMPEP_0178387946 /NCGR_PEP_ID=MMETSP0689_2-20121128/9339_1 /TAXON_ID=160604 /ORGANISM="Amphidinium massartii, Strain CS-259" /LENGTH=205 /DNA_ID=CAMNT_0020008333 /DNA_START=124 /DNA_END=741 /DNA_ORIENTATION=+
MAAVGMCAPNHNKSEASLTNSPRPSESHSCDVFLPSLSSGAEQVDSRTGSGASDLESAGRLAEWGQTQGLVIRPQTQSGADSDNAVNAPPAEEDPPAQPEQVAVVQPAEEQSIPFNADGELTSVGSIAHGTGECFPCAYWFKGICKYGLNCTSCHFVHEGQKSKRLRPSKHVRMRFRRAQALQRQNEADDNDDDENGGEGDGNSN